MRVVACQQRPEAAIRPVAIHVSFVRTAAIGPMKMLRDERMAVLGKLRCGTRRASEGPVWAVCGEGIGRIMAPPAAGLCCANRLRDKPPLTPDRLILLAL